MENQRCYCRNGFRSRQRAEADRLPTRMSGFLVMLSTTTKKQKTKKELMLKIQSRKETSGNNLRCLPFLRPLFFPCRKKTPPVRWFIINCIKSERVVLPLGPAVNLSPERGAAGGVSSATCGVLVEQHALWKVSAQPRSPPGASVDFPPRKNRSTTDHLHYQLQHR